MNPEDSPRLIRAIHEQHLDGLLAVSPENVAYVVGFPLGGPDEPRWRQAAALVTWDGRTALLCVDAHAEAVRRRMRTETVVRSWGEFGDNPTHILADLLAEFHLSQSRIGTELDYLAAADFRVLRLGAEECRVAVWRAEAGERGAILGVEVTSRIEGYHAVMARTAAPGLPGELRRQWKERVTAHRSAELTTKPRADRSPDAWGLRRRAVLAH